jgi:hypothetical protein
MPPSHAALIDRIFAEQRAWSTVERRLRTYPAIAKHFDLDMMRAAQGTPPFHVHYMAWRLGMWANERNFEVLDRLLGHAASLPGWEHELPLMRNADFGTFWALLWQLQVAARLAETSTNVSWGGASAPDLCAHTDDGRVFVECYSFQKRLGVLEFVTELCRWLGDDITIQRNLAIPISFGANPSAPPRQSHEFLDELFSGLLGAGVIEGARSRATVRQPVDLPMPAGTKNLWLVVEGDGEYVPTMGRHGSGDPERYLDFVVSEALRYKSGKNRLADHRPNVVAASSLLGPDYQVSRSLRGSYTPPAHFPPDIDVLALSATGIDTESAVFQHGYYRPGYRHVLEVLGVPAVAQTEGEILESPRTGQQHE